MHIAVTYYTVTRKIPVYRYTIQTHTPPHTNVSIIEQRVFEKTAKNVDSRSAKTVVTALIVTFLCHPPIPSMNLGIDAKRSYNFWFGVGILIYIHTLVSGAEKTYEMSKNTQGTLKRIIGGDKPRKHSQNRVPTQ